MTDASSAPGWGTTLYSLPLSDEEKGQAAAILARMPNAEVLFLGNATSSEAAVRKLLEPGAAPGLGPPQSTAGDAAAPAPVPAAVLMAVEGVVEGAVDRALKRHHDSTVSVSSFNPERWSRLSAAAALQLENVELPVVAEESLATASVPAFQWGEMTEPAHALRYREYLKGVIKLPELLDYPLMWVPPTLMGKDLLSLAGWEDTLHYSHIKGNTDVAIARCVSVKARTPSCGLCLLFEIKKPEAFDQGSVFQAACELVLANIHSSNLLPVVVLTDLVDEWTLLWINSNKVVVAPCGGREKAVVLIQGCVLQAEQRIKAERNKAAGGSAEGMAAERSSQPLLPQDLLERKQWTPPSRAAGADVANIEDLEGFLSPEEMLQAHAMAGLAAVRRIPAFSSMGSRGVPPGMFS